MQAKRGRQGEGLRAADKARRLDQLRGAILRAGARRELALREIESDGEFRPRGVHPEFVIATVKELQQLAR